MNNGDGKTGPGFFERLTTWTTCWVGSVHALFFAFLAILAWAASGPLFKFSDTWQLVINTGTTIVTFLMVFIIQRSQNKDTLALHLKLNEIIAALKRADNRFINIEDMPEEEVRKLHERFNRLTEQLRDAGQPLRPGEEGVAGTVQPATAHGPATDHADDPAWDGPIKV